MSTGKAAPGNDMIDIGAKAPLLESETPMSPIDETPVDPKGRQAGKEIDPVNPYTYQCSNNGGSTPVAPFGQNDTGGAIFQDGFASTRPSQSDSGDATTSNEAGAYRESKSTGRLWRFFRGFLLFFAGLAAMATTWQYVESGSLNLTDWPPYGVSSVGDISDSNDSAVSNEFSNPSFYEVTLEDNGGIWSYDDDGYGGVTAINPLGSGWPNNISWSEIEGGEQEILYCWAPTQDEAVNIALDAVEFGEGFGRDEFRGFGEEAERVEPEPHCELAPMF